MDLSTLLLDIIYNIVYYINVGDWYGGRNSCTSPVPVTYSTLTNISIYKIYEIANNLK